MKIRIGNGREYEIEPEVIDYLSLKYGMEVLTKYEKLDNTLQFGAKIITKRIVNEFLKAFGVSPKLPRGTDPSIYLIRAYIILMNESLKRASVRLMADETTGKIYDQELEFDNTSAFASLMAGYLENLKQYGRTESATTEPETAELAAASPDRTGPELAPGGQEAEWEDDGGEESGGWAVPAIS